MPVVRGIIQDWRRNSLPRDQRDVVVDWVLMEVLMDYYDPLLHFVTEIENCQSFGVPESP